MIFSFIVIGKTVLTRTISWRCIDKVIYVKDQQIEGENILFREPGNESLFYLIDQIKKA